MVWYYRKFSLKCPHIVKKSMRRYVHVFCAFLMRVYGWRLLGWGGEGVRVQLEEAHDHW